MLYEIEIKIAMHLKRIYFLIYNLISKKLKNKIQKLEAKIAMDLKRFIFNTKFNI